MIRGKHFPKGGGNDMGLISLRLSPGILKSDWNGRRFLCPSFQKGSACCSFVLTAAVWPQESPELLFNSTGHCFLLAQVLWDWAQDRKRVLSWGSVPETQYMKFTMRLKTWPTYKRLIKSSLLVCSSFLRWNQFKFWPLSSNIFQRDQSALPPSGPAAGVWRMEGSDSPLTTDTLLLLL